MMDGNRILVERWWWYRAFGGEGLSVYIKFLWENNWGRRGNGREEIGA